MSPGVYAWTLHRDVDLATLLALDTSFQYSCNVDVKILRTFEDRDIVIVKMKEEVFQLDITSMVWKKLNLRTNSITLYPYTITPG